MLVHIENLKESTINKLLELISEFSKVAGYRVTKINFMFIY